ncbi:MAG: cytochrome c3 family protein [Deltaproteobacteria bacterium]|nr:cytochrome c3 family protein [Deltaproteobacteria bacterium]
MKKIILVASSALFALGLCLGSAQAVDAPKAPVKVTNYGKKDVVTFDHAKHAKDTKCEECHHKKGNEKGEHKCGKCHGKEDDAKTKAPKMESAAHKKDLGVCYKCHKAEDAKNKLKCADCHKK